MTTVIPRKLTESLLNHLCTTVEYAFSLTCLLSHASSPPCHPYTVHSVEAKIIKSYHAADQLTEVKKLPRSLSEEESPSLLTLAQCLLHVPVTGRGCLAQPNGVPARHGSCL